MSPVTRRSLRNIDVDSSVSTEENNDDDNEQTENIKNQKKKTETPSLRRQLNLLTVPILKDILRLNGQNPFGNKAKLISNIIYFAKNGGYPSCPKCKNGRLKLRLHRRKNQSKYYCPGFPISFRGPGSFHRCDYETDQCQRKRFFFPRSLKINTKK